ncbi:MAG: Crp/Fnr family transcriptional regulator [Desulfobacterales bacterium]|nr:Crp/Fnr family transcriptional regulator [Desulfobacterales bacterium]
MKKKREVISKTFLFNGLSDSHLEEIERISIPNTFNKGETVFSEGEPCKGFYIIVDGQVKIYKVSLEGKEHILHILGPGEPFGEVPAFTGQPFPASAELIVKSQLLFFPRPAFVELISRSPFLALNMLAVLSKRLFQFTLQIESLSLKDVPGRLAAYLIYLRAEQEKKDAVTLTISKGQLASLLGTIPETLSRIFAKMTELNLIEVQGRSIRLLDIDGLRQIGESGKSLS